MMVHSRPASAEWQTARASDSLTDAPSGYDELLAVRCMSRHPLPASRPYLHVCAYR